MSGNLKSDSSNCEKVPFYYCNFELSKCKRKYKTERGWWKHMTEGHKVHGPILPKPVLEVPKRSNKRKNTTKKPRKPRNNKKKKDNHQEKKETGNHTQDQDEEEECVICMDTKSDTAVIPCGHATFCYDCIFKVGNSSKNPVCPNCRSPMKGVMKLFR